MSPRNVKICSYIHIDSSYCPYLSLRLNFTSAINHTILYLHLFRTSRVDQLENGDTQRHIIRPSSLPYKPSSSQSSKSSKITPPRRAVSSSLSRKQAENSVPK